MRGEPIQLTRLRLVRHARVDTGPPPGRLCGALDLPLSDGGRRDLATLQERAAPPPPAALYSSDLRRAKETAAALATWWKLPCSIERAVGEIDCGRLEGMNILDLQRQHAEEWERNLAEQDDDFRWPGGESYREFRARVLSALQRIADRHLGRQVVVVTHTGVITQVIGSLRGVPAARWNHHRAAPLSASEVIWGPAGPAELMSFSQAAWW